MKKIISLFTIVLSTSFGFGQLNITDADYTSSNPLDCSVYNTLIANFVDDGAGADYSPGITETFTVCPDLTVGGLKIRGVFGNATGLTWDVDGSDTLYVYDGPNTSSPLLGAYNSTNSPVGFSETASWANTSGCLTFVFVSDGANQGTGWDANIRCVSPPQDIEMHIEAFINGTPGNDMFPLDTGYVDICQGDSILFVAKPIFNYSFENTGVGYSQNINNVDYLWEFSDGFVGPNNDSIWFNPSSQGGFFVDLRITDAFPSNTTMRCKVRTSTTPLFTGTGPLEDTVCFNQNTELSGGVTSADTVGVNVPLGSFQLGGTFAGLTFLPDGNGDEYTTNINMSGFAPGSTVQAGSDVMDVCINMEHSYLGDLEIWLECLDGTEVALVNSYSPGYIPGGFGGGGIFLGEPLDNTGGTPGNGYEYCFSSVNNTFGTFTAEYTNNTIPTPVGAPSAGNTMDPNGVYEPDGVYTDFIGCPLNGNWTLHVQDNIGSDDGYIFEWGIYFDPSLFPDNEFYQNTITDAYWSQNPTIVSDTTNDTLIIVDPNGPGDYSYIFNVIDDFGCAYDTTVALHVLDTTINITSLDTTLFCFNDSVPLWTSATGTVPPFDYTWSDGQTGDTAIYEALVNGVTDYIITVTDACGIVHTDTATITVNQTLSIDSLNQFPADCGIDNGNLLAFPSGITGTPDYTWSGPGAGNPANTESTAWLSKPSGWYYFLVSDAVCSALDSIFLEQLPPPTASFTANPSEGPSPLGVTFVNTSDPASQYDWDFGNGFGNTVFDQSDQSSTYVDNGTYTVTLVITAGACTDQATETVFVFDPISYDMTNVFTPNGDGENDFFTVNAGNATALEIVILNRWGNVVFESDDPNFVWNGKVNNNGAECTDGTYFYKFTIEGEGGQSETEHGFVQLLSGKK
jgi:gliding motility-associated-like protein